MQLPAAHFAFWTLLRRYCALLMVSLLLAIGCTKMPADSLFEFMTAADRQNAALADAVDATDDSATEDTATADADDAFDSDDADDAQEVRDAADTADIAQDATPLSDADAEADVPTDATAVADAGDATAATDAGDAADSGADVPEDTTAVADAVDDAGDVTAVDDATDATVVDDAGGDDGVSLPDIDTSVDADDADGGDDAVADADDATAAVDAGGATCVPADCDDGNACTADSCSVGGTCEHTSTSGSCDDGNACTVGDQCSGDTCVAGSAPSCDDGNVCTTDACVAPTGCSNTAVAGSCSDGDACTVADACVGTSCVAGEPLVCAPDGDPCTNDVCQSGSCAHPPAPVHTPCGLGQSCDATAICVVNDAVAMASLPTGTYAMGSLEGQGAADEQPQHTVTVSAFALDTTEVTVGQYKAFYASLNAAQQCAATNSVEFTCAQPDSAATCTWNGADLLPINCVDWFQASAYCAWAGKRLPTEAEWEYAARSGGLTQAYPWGDQAADCGLAICDEAGAGGPGCGAGAPDVVCSKSAGKSAQGACDLSGNIAEWCNDWYDLYAPATATDPSGPVSSPQGTRAVRGGSWSALASVLRSASRSAQAPASRPSTTGFRCVRAN